MSDNIEVLGQRVMETRARLTTARKDFGTDSAEYQAALEASRAAQAAYDAARKRAQQSTDESNQ